MSADPKPAKQPLPLNYIRSFESAARHLSFTAAAQELGYTQAAVSSHVRALEHHIGWPLFERFARSLRLTETGEAFLPTLRQGLDQIDLATEAIAARARSRTVVISCPVSLAENWLAARLAGFRRLHGDIDIVVQGTVWEDPQDQAADLSITVRRFDAVPAHAERLWQDSLVLLCAPALLAARPVSRAQDLAGFDRIEVLGRQECWQAMASHIGLPDMLADRPVTTNSTNIALELAAEGGGLVVAQASLAGLYLRRGLLAEPLPVRLPSPWTYYLSASPTARGTACRTVQDWIRAQAAALDFL